jgi:hypothetical protein
MNSGKIRVLIFSIFLFALLIFAVIYEPTKAMSGPNPQSSGAPVAAQQAAQNQ